MTVIEKQYMDAVIAINRRMRNKEIDWEQRRYEVAKDSLTAILSNPELVSGVTQEGEPKWGTPASVASVAVKFADLLIGELQKENS